MAKTKAAPQRSPPGPAAQEVALQAPLPNSVIPEPLRFPLLVALNIIVSALLYTLASPFTKGDLATVSGRRDQWWEIAGLLGWKTIELAVGWWGGYDSEFTSSFCPFSITNCERSYRFGVSDLLDPCALPILPHQLLQDLNLHRNLLCHHRYSCDMHSFSPPS